MDERAAVAALVSDLHAQIEQIKARGIKNKAGSPYNPTHYKRGLQAAIAGGGLSVVEFVRGYLYKSPSGGYQRLQEAEALDLACEYLVADADRPYAHLFTDEDRERAQRRLAPHLAAVEERKASVSRDIERTAEDLPSDLAALRERADAVTSPEEAVAVNEAILRQDPSDAAAGNRLGRALLDLGRMPEAAEAFENVLVADPGNSIAQRRLETLRQSKTRAV